MKTLFRNATVVNADGSRIADVLVCGEKISAVSEKIVCPDAEEIDCSGLLLFPGAIDAHTHFDLDVAGTTTADDFASGSRAAARGGYTAVCAMPTSSTSPAPKRGRVCGTDWSSGTKRPMGGAPATTAST